MLHLCHCKRHWLVRVVAEHNWGGVIPRHTDCVPLHWLLLLLLLCVV
jgi:hypothetical protein